MGYDLDSIRGEYPFEPKTFSIGGLKMSYIDEGPEDAPAIVMLHGNPTWSFYFRKLVFALRGKYRVIAPDHIGCGLSDKPQDYDYTLATHIKNLTALLDHLSPGKVTLAMHDWGGAIGMGYAADHPEKVESLVIFNTSAFLSERIPFRINILRIPGFGALMVRGLNAFARSAIYLRMATKRPERFTRVVRRGYLLPYDSWKNRIAVLQFVQDIPMSASDRSYGRLKSIEEKLPLFQKTPSLVLWGKRDFCFNNEFLDGWLKRLKNTEAHMFEDAGHYVVEDAHERIVPLMENFLERVYGES